jgi:molybdopterin converting factor small subunit
MDPATLSSRPATGHVTLRYWAAARAAAGVETDLVEVSGPVTLADLVAESLRRHPDSDRLSQVLDCCSVLIGDRPAATEDRRTVTVEPGQHVEFLPPFAGG